MSDNNNEFITETNEDLMKHTKAELVELLEKEQRKVTKHKKEKAELRKELKENEEDIQKAAKINENNEEYLQSLSEKLNRAETRLMGEGQTLSEVVQSVSEVLDLVELTVKQARKAIQFNLARRGREDE